MVCYVNGRAKLSSAVCVSIIGKMVQRMGVRCSQNVLWVQLTALGNPKLLERVSAGLVAIRNLFGQFDLDHDNVVSHEEFEKVCTSDSPFLLECIDLSATSAVLCQSFHLSGGQARGD